MYDFLVLDQNQRAEILWKKGLFLINRKEDKYSFTLYSFNDHYVEVIMSNFDNKIIQIIPFRQGWRLEKYLDELVLPSWNNES